MDAVLARANRKKVCGRPAASSRFSQPVAILVHQVGLRRREPISTMQGKPIQKSMDGFHVRSALCRPIFQPVTKFARKVHGHDRGGGTCGRHPAGHGEGGGYAAAASPVYTSSMAFFGHSVGEIGRRYPGPDFCCRQSLGGPGILVPTRNAALVPLVSGRTDSACKYPMTLMSVGMYREPAWIFLAVGSVLAWFSIDART